MWAKHGLRGTVFWERLPWPGKNRGCGQNTAYVALCSGSVCLSLERITDVGKTRPTWHCVLGAFASGLERIKDVGKTRPTWHCVLGAFVSGLERIKDVGKTRPTYTVITYL